MPELIKIYWRDIPSQVTAKAGRKTAKVMLPGRFQEAIDRAAMRAGKGSSDAYMEDWRRDRSPCSADLQSEADNAAAELVKSLDEEQLEALVKVKGIAANLGKTRAEIAAQENDLATAADTNTRSESGSAARAAADSVASASQNSATGSISDTNKQAD